MKRGIISIMSAMFALCLWSAPAKATPVTTIYEFLPEQSTLYHSGGIMGGSGPYSIEGWFELIVDYDVSIASFNRADALLTNKWEDDYPYGRDLDYLFYLTELTSTSLSDSQINFEGYFNLFPRWPVEWIVLVDLTFIDDRLVHLTGSKQELQPGADSSSFYLDAVGVFVPEPATICLLSLGGVFVLLRKKLR